MDVGKQIAQLGKLGDGPPSGRQRQDNDAAAGAGEKQLRGAEDTGVLF